MDRGLFGASRETERRAATPNRGETAHRAVEEPQPPVEHHRQSAPSHHAPAPKKSGKGAMFAVIIGAIVVVLGIAVWFVASRLTAASSGIDSSKYQAVFLSNGQVYFGKLQSVNDQYLKLTNVFYIQGSSTDTDTSNSEDPQQSKTANSDMKLIKLGKEVHGPEDAMIINRDQVQFYENLKSDGEVAKLISQYKE